MMTSKSGLLGRWFGRIAPRQLLFNDENEGEIDNGEINNEMVNLDNIEEAITVAVPSQRNTDETPTTLRTSSSLGESTQSENDCTYETLLNERNELLRQREEMKKRFAESLQTDKLAYDGNTIRMGGKRPQYQGKDSANWIRVTNLAAFIFRNLKMLPKDWYEFSTVPNTICDRIMKCGLDMPYEFAPKFYYENVLRKMFLGKYRSLKTNFTTVCRELYLGEYYSVVLGVPHFDLTLLL